LESISEKNNIIQRQSIAQVKIRTPTISSEKRDRNFLNLDLNEDQKWQN
jgi:hypothetical protein